MCKLFSRRVEGTRRVRRLLHNISTCANDWKWLLLYKKEVKTATSQTDRRLIYDDVIIEGKLFLLSLFRGLSLKRKAFPLENETKKQNKNKHHGDVSSHPVLTPRPSYHSLQRLPHLAFPPPPPPFLPRCVYTTLYKSVFLFLFFKSIFENIICDNHHHRCVNQ